MLSKSAPQPIAHSKGQRRGGCKPRSYRPRFDIQIYFVIPPYCKTNMYRGSYVDGIVKPVKMVSVDTLLVSSNDMICLALACLALTLL